MGRKRITMVFEGNNVKILDTGTPINNAVRMYRRIQSKGAFTYDRRCFGGIFDLPTYLPTYLP